MRIMKQIKKWQNIIVEKNILEILFLAKWVDMGGLFIKMENIMKDNGNKIKNMAMVHIFFQTEIIILYFDEDYF